MKQPNVREEALNIILRVDKDGGFSHLLVSNVIQKNSFDTRDANLLTELVYGTIEEKLTLDYYIRPFVKRPGKVEDWVMSLLRMSVFQYVYLDKIPMYAIINEAVTVAKSRGHKGISSFVNGVLRTMERKGLPDTASIADDIERLSVQTSTPKWLVERWTENYGYERTRRICEANKEKKPMTIRVNPQQVSTATMKEWLTDEGFLVESSSVIPNALQILEGNILKTDYVNLGYVTIQDISSMLAAQMLEVKPEMAVLDTCSAPGGKTGLLGENMHNTGVVHAYDLHVNKIRLVKEQANRLGLDNIQAKAMDARKLQEVYSAERFDRILVDAPCSGFGVIRSKPDIKYAKTKQQMARLPEIQLDILSHVAVLLHKGGKLVYCTCTMETAENEEVVKKFLDKHPEYTVDTTFLKEIEKFREQDVNITPFGLQIFPQSLQSDGFFISRLIRQSAE
ncbi:MAG TPA: 16S rRNA (cytosine(967)-C(5))-methyltransferase RsmB [Pseudogracilibacillus sp.]|nr:16S rRNA (cytosine(967)-C(5))-methyltransferase RsmB [Pseudogracilibacillus sp.]